MTEVGDDHDLVGASRPRFFTESIRRLQSVLTKRGEGSVFTRQITYLSDSLLSITGGAGRLAFTNEKNKRTNNVGHL